MTPLSLSESEITDCLGKIEPRIILVSNKYHALYGDRWAFVRIIRAEPEHVMGFMGRAIFIVDSDDPIIEEIMEGYKACGCLISRM